MNRKKIIKSYGFYEITPSMMSEKFGLFTIITLVSAIAMPLFSIFLTSHFSERDIAKEYGALVLLIIVIIGALTGLMVMCVLEKLYKMSKKPWIRKIEKVRESMLSNIRGTKKIIQEFEDKFAFYLSDVNAEKIRKFLFEFYDPEDFVLITIWRNDFISKSDNEIMQLFSDKGFKEEMSSFFEERINSTKKRLKVLNKKLSSFDKMVKELGFEV